MSSNVYLLAVARLQRELDQLNFCPPTGCSAGPREDINLFHWEGAIFGPKNTPYEDGVFNINIEFPEDYPNQPPKVMFKTPIFHPNVDTISGEISLEILQYKWSSDLTLTMVLTSIVQLLLHPNLEEKDIMAPEIAMIYKENRQKFNHLAIEWTKMHAM